MNSVAESIEGLPNICGSEAAVEETMRPSAGHQVFAGENPIDFNRIRSAAAIALHMHQPLVPAGGNDLRTAAMIGHLQYMMEHPRIGDNHNAPVFHWCYKRMGEFVPQLIDEGKEPRVMLEYSGTLLHGLWQMGLHDVFERLRRITCEPRYRRAVEWLGCAWGHPVAPSTPVQDYRLHVKAWQQHFAGIFGLEALGRVRGFSPAEMALPNHPDVAYDFVRTLRECGYEWVLVQEHSIERPDGGAPVNKHIPHWLICRSSAGESAGIRAIIKTQGSDTKLVGQMQPYYEAKSLARCDVGGQSVPPLATQIADGENGGVMMNEFPPKYLDVVRESSGSDTPLLNVSEYLEHLSAAGIKDEDLPVVQPIFQKRIWDRLEAGAGPGRLAIVIDALRREDSRFHVEGGTWTNNISWVRGYETLLGPMERLSALFHDKVLQPGLSPAEPRYRNALFHLLISQTSCYRYWGQGQWVEYGREICRRGQAILNHDF
jgi:Glycosyl hydrolase family 57